MFKLVRIIITHGIALGVGFALGIYLLPILIAPDGPSHAEVVASAKQAVFTARFTRDLAGSDFLHWGEGSVSISEREISFVGEMAPGPDYNLYLSPKLVQTEVGFLALKAQSAKIGPVKTFDKFILELPDGIDPTDYEAVVIWCESFGEFITAASYR